MEIIEKIELRCKSSLSFFIFKRKTAFAEGGKNEIKRKNWWEVF